MTIPFHQFAELFPLMCDAEFEELVEDIRENGVRDPIVLHQGSVLDGRNRYRALIELSRTGELRGPGWGAYHGMPITEEDLAPDVGLPWYEGYSAMLMGEPLAFVISLNLRRRHLNDAQRASVAAKIATLVPQRPGFHNLPPIGGRSAATEEAAAKLNVSTRQVERALVVHDKGVPELREALDRGEVAVSRAEQIARMPEPEQVAAVNTMVSSARAIAPTRAEPNDSLDYFPTPPWATRALIEHAFGCLPEVPMRSIWEPACGEGHMAEVLREFCDNVLATDIFDYGYSDKPPCDFLSDEAAEYENPEWIMSNPPFGDRALPFVITALERATVGVAMFMRSQWAVEGVDRYLTLFRKAPPTLCAFFVERVPLCKGRWNPDGDTLTAYCWLIWVRDASQRPPFWIPPVCRKQLSKPDDAERFTAHPVIKRTSIAVATAQSPAAPSIPPFHQVADEILTEFHQVADGILGETTAPKVSA